ncbi:hypothetical protein RclHR1_04180007 [Rhizophagus clarus]|uniref:High mobility group box domain-containing protein n=1 Tax=Rhizophagus clarus TaxID=94130 RepID=A0A2Z6RWM9_9GLOM|nr:hypothetical protein RclHR1_04180007 [Rhizophagus clarus]GES97830.1 high mobility group box domain-containing protein [Rhizophagus clarus]
MEYNYISLLPDDQSSTERKNYNNYLHEEVTQTEFLQIIQNPPCELHLNVDDLLSSSSKSKKHDHKPPRSQNPYILYRRNQSKRRERLGLTNSLGAASKEISEMWRNESPETKKFFQILAAEGDRRHRLRYPDYKYDPIRKNSRFKNVRHRHSNNHKEPKVNTEENASIGQSQSEFVFIPEFPHHTINSTQL